MLQRFRGTHTGIRDRGIPAKTSAPTGENSPSDETAGLPEGFPRPPKSSDYDLGNAGGRARFVAALKAWKAKLTPAQNAQLKDSLGMNGVDPKQKAELD